MEINNPEIIIERLKTIFNVKTDIALASRLNTHRTLFYQWKKSKKIDFNIIAKAAELAGKSPDYILYGNPKVDISLIEKIIVTHKDLQNCHPKYNELAFKRQLRIITIVLNEENNSPSFIRELISLSVSE